MPYRQPRRDEQGRHLASIAWFRAPPLHNSSGVLAEYWGWAEVRDERLALGYRLLATFPSALRLLAQARRVDLVRGALWSSGCGFGIVNACAGIADSPTAVLHLGVLPVYQARSWHKRRAKVALDQCLSRACMPTTRLRRSASALAARR